MEKYWATHPDEVFSPCTSEVDGDKVYFIDEHGKRVTGKGGLVTHPVAKLGELPKVHEAQLSGVGNVCELVVVDNAAVLHTVRTRYKRTDIYTFVSKMLVAVNPFRDLPVYSKENLMRYLGATSTMDLPPHIYALGLHAVKGLQQPGGTSQVVLISGESGAGKTESAKLVMHWGALATCSDGTAVPDIPSLQTLPDDGVDTPWWTRPSPAFRTKSFRRIPS